MLPSVGPGAANSGPNNDLNLLHETMFAFSPYDGLAVSSVSALIGLSIHSFHISPF